MNVLKSMKASIVVPTYNRCSSLKACVGGLLRQTLSSHEYEIIVVDDCSHDATMKYMEAACKDSANLVYIRHKANKGRVIARNNGIKVAKGGIIVFIDNDNTPSPIFVESHRRYHDEAGGNHIAVMGNVSYAPEAINNSNFGKYMQRRYLGYRVDKKIKLDNLPGHYFGTLNASVRKEDLIEVGLFNERFRFYGGEDEYMGYCLIRIGVRIIFGEEARSIHYDDVTIPRIRSKYLEGGREALPIMLEKAPEYRLSTKTGCLLPIRLKDDPILTIFKKLAILAFINRFSLKMIEIYARTIDRYPSAYCPFVYRLLLAGWVRQGFKSKKKGFSQVSY